MELVRIARVLVHHRRVVGLAALLALAAGLAIATTRGTAPTRGLAQVKVFVDTRASYAGDLAGGTEALGLQAALLGALIANERQATMIARRSGVAADSLEVLVAGITEPKRPSTLTRSIASTLTAPQRPNAVVISADSSVAIVSIIASAPTAAIAGRLAAASTDALRAVTAAKAPSPQRSLVIRQLGAVRAIGVSDAGLPGAVLGFAVAVALFTLFCGAIVIASGLARTWRAWGLRTAG